MAGDTYIGLRNGKPTSIKTNQASAGNADAGKVVALNAEGHIDDTMLKNADTRIIEASEALSAGDFVQVFDDGGTPKMRKSDNSNARNVDGFVRDAITSGASGKIYLEGVNPGLSGLTIGDRYYLDTSGQPTNTPLDQNDVANVGKIHQYLGKAVSATEIQTEPADCVLIQ